MLGAWVGCQVQGFGEGLDAWSISQWFLGPSNTSCSSVSGMLRSGLQRPRTIISTVFTSLETCFNGGPLMLVLFEFTSLWIAWGNASLWSLGPPDESFYRDLYHLGMAS